MIYSRKSASKRYTRYYACIAYSKHITWDNGEETTLGQMERAFPLVENGKVTTLFFAVMDGTGGFNNGTKSWNLAIPLTQITH